MDARDSGNQVTLTFAGDRPLREVLIEALTACRRLALEAADEARANIMIEELLINIFEHGGLTPDGAVRMSLGRAADSLRVEIYDTGRPFDPSSTPRDAPMPDRGGGAGLNIVRAWADLRSYEAGPSLNRLVLWIPLRRGI